jgi:hypothetical protein
MSIETKTGVYIAYPRAREFHVAHEGPDILVNNRYTCVGFTRDSFAASGEACRRAFSNRVKFIPLVEIDQEHIPQMKKLVLGTLAREFDSIGNSDHWFDTQNRQAIISLIYRLLSPAANDSGNQQDESVEKTG